LVEISVVMGIIAILSGSAAVAFISARDQHILDNTLEETVNFIRDAQINSVAIAQLENGDIPKGWGVEMNNEGDEAELRLHIIKHDGSVIEEDKFIPVVGTKFELTDDFGFLFFVAPFGEPYIVKDICNWETSGRRSEEVRPGNDCNISENELELKITYKNTHALLKIDKRGGVVVSYD
jgi:hypothetical protein